MDIFISYSSEDISIAKKICQIIKRNSFSYWVAHENGDFGEHYAATIIKQISDAKIFIVLVSKLSNLSTHVISEINSAVMRDKLIIPIILDDVKLSPAMEYYLASNHYLKYNQNDEFKNQLINRISSLLGLSTTISSDTTVETSAECDDILNNNGEKSIQFKKLAITDRGSVNKLADNLKKHKGNVLKFLIAILIAVCLIGVIFLPKPTDDDDIETPAVSASYVTSAKSSSALTDEKYEIEYSVDKVLDGDTSTCWSEGAEGDGIGETIEFDLSESCLISGFTIHAGHHGSEKLYYENSRPKKIRVIFSEGEKYTFKLDDVFESQTINFKKTIETKSVKFEIISVYKGDKYEDTVISEIVFF